MKKRWQPLLVLLCLSLNIGAVLIFRRSIQLTQWSIFPILLLLGLTLNAIVAYWHRDKSNYLIHSRGARVRYYLSRKDVSAQAYRAEFNWMFTLYCAVLPFYLPVICFASAVTPCLLCTMALYAAPQLTYLAIRLYEAGKNAKNWNRKRKKQAAERQEQERKEELGRWK